MPFFLSVAAADWWRLLTRSDPTIIHSPPWLCLCCHRRARLNQGIVMKYCYFCLENTKKRFSFTDSSFMTGREVRGDAAHSPQKRREFRILFLALEGLWLGVSRLIQRFSTVISYSNSGGFCYATSGMSHWQHGATAISAHIFSQPLNCCSHITHLCNSLLYPQPSILLSCCKMVTPCSYWISTKTMQISPELLERITNENTMII